MDIQSQISKLETNYPNPERFIQGSRDSFIRPERGFAPTDPSASNINQWPRNGSTYYPIKNGDSPIKSNSKIPLESNM